MNREKNENSSHTKAGDTIRHAGKKIDQFSENVADQGDKIVHKSQDAIEEIQDGIEKGYGNVRQYIKKHPLKSALIAGGVGLIVGRLLKK